MILPSRRRSVAEEDIAERFLEEQAYVPAGGHLQSLVGHGRTKYIFDQRLAAAGVVGLTQYTFGVENVKMVVNLVLAA